MRDKESDRERGGGRELLNNKEFNGVKGRERERRVIDSKR